MTFDEPQPPAGWWATPTFLADGAALAALNPDAVRYAFLHWRWSVSVGQVHGIGIVGHYNWLKWCEVEREAEREADTATDHEHTYGPFQRSRLAGTLHRPCTFPGCRVVSLDDDGCDCGSWECVECAAMMTLMGMDPA